MCYIVYVGDEPVSEFHTRGGAEIEERDLLDAGFIDVEIVEDDKY